MNPTNIVVRFDQGQVAEQVEGPVRRIVGFVRARNMLKLFDSADLEANPRSAKAGAVTDAIIESIVDTPDTFPFKTKGILVGASNYEKLERNRFEQAILPTVLEIEPQLIDQARVGGIGIDQRACHGGCREPFIPVQNGEIGLLGKVADEGARCLYTRSLGAIHIERQAEDQGDDAMFCREIQQALGIIRELFAPNRF